MPASLAGPFHTRDEIMIIPLGGLLIGALFGAFNAKRRGGNWADVAQWAAVGAVVLGVIGLGVMIALDRTMS